MQIKVLDSGYVEYQGHFGTDQDIPRIARVSTGSENKGEAADKKLLNYLYRNSHSSPFEFCNITYKLKLPLFVRDQIVRHRTGKYNIHSFRYAEPEEEFYLPIEFRRQAVKNHQSSEGTFSDSENNDIFVILQTQAIQQYRDYKRLIDMGVAREMARMILGTNCYTYVFMQMDCSNLMKFFRLRLSDHAQQEVREYAAAMYEIFKSKFPWCAECYEKYSLEIKDNSKIE